ncbi:hypothetical protein [Cryobacterium psychrophilum]|uniref:Uncharacterized protein n=1 Tax=Cryobacterium psychrophilum TaxID=41988 RepID=A0A4Y8KQ28_9MICO|nr:hypothetical protein [Cryobacterium psychrophilum]TDW31031.1 hypothetical protein EDD25_2819 [Cryobacterium psychrophilum]TFD80884.1 hypothetical protein E3T53_04490 [Cryobacterium psychrophilum]
MIQFTPDIPMLIWLAVTVILPILVGLVTTRETSPARKAIFLSVLAFAAGILTNLLASITAGMPYDLFAGLVQGLATFLIAVAAYFGLWKPTGVASAAQAVGTGKHAA